MLTRVTGTVVRGDGAAQSHYQCPTANLQLSRVPNLNSGIYIGFCSCDGFQDKPCVIAYGAAFIHPQDRHPKFEVHVLDWVGELYEKKMEVEVLELISGIVPFRGMNEMRKKIQHDLEVARIRLADYVHRDHLS